MEEAPHLGRLSLLWGSAREQWLLHGAILGLTVSLDLGRDLELKFEENGAGSALRSDGSESKVEMSVSDFFDFALLQSAAQPRGMTVLARDGSVRPLQEYRQEHEAPEVPLWQASLACTSVCLV